MSIFLDSELTASERSEAARFRVIPVPLERTVSYGSAQPRAPTRSLRPAMSWSASPATPNPALKASSPKPP